MRSNLTATGLDLHTRTDTENEFHKLARLKRWTPVLTCGTPGDLSVSYTTQLGEAVRVRRLVTVSFFIVTSAFTWTTASGSWEITGLPYTASTDTNDSGMRWCGSMNYAGITKASYTGFVPTITAGDNFIKFVASGSAQSDVFLAAADMPTGGMVILNGSLTFRVRG